MLACTADRVPVAQSFIEANVQQAREHVHVLTAVPILREAVKTCHAEEAVRSRLGEVGARDVDARRTRHVGIGGFYLPFVVTEAQGGELDEPVPIPVVHETVFRDHIAEVVADAGALKRAWFSGDT